MLSTRIEYQDGVAQAELVSRQCLLMPMCVPCPYKHPADPEQCGTSFTPEGVVCDFDPACIPRWYLEELRTRYGGICDTLYAEGSPFILDCSLPSDNTTVLSICCLLKCVGYILDDRRGFGDCVTLDDIGGAVPSGVDPDEWEVCRQFLVRTFFWWAEVGHGLTIQHCLGLPLGAVVPGESDMWVTYQTIEIMDYQKSGDGCLDKPIDEVCDECPS